MKTATRIPPGIYAAHITKTEQLRHAFAVRHEAYCTAGLMACELAADQPHDQWDSDSNTRHYLLTDNGDPIGSARAIDGSSVHGLQVSSFISLGSDTRKLVEISRVALSPSYRGNRHVALLHLLGAFIQDQWRLGRYYWVQTMRAPMVKILAGRYHIPFKVSTVIADFDRNAPGVPLTGEALYLAKVDLRHVAAHTFVVDQGIYQGLFGRVEPLVNASPSDIAIFAGQIASSLAAVKK